MEIQSQNLEAENIEQVDVLDLGTKDLNVFFKSDGAKITKFEKNETSEAGGTNTYKITFDDGDQVTMTIKNGQNGAKGDTGAQGIQGIQGEKGEQGQQGQKGADGTNGADGFSPTASVTQTANGATISITDKNGTTQAAIANVTITPNADKSVTISNGTSSEKFLPQSSVAKWGVVSQTQNWTSVKSVYNYTMSNLQYGWIPIDFINKMEAEGAVFNETSGYIELNGLTDISYKEAIDIFNKTNGALDGIYHKNALFCVVCRTNIKPKIHSALTTSTSSCGDEMFCCFSGSTFEIIDLDSGNFYFTNNSNQVFSSCYKLKKILGVIYFKGITNLSSSPFTNCYSLEEVRINGLKHSLDIKNSSLLSIESIMYMVANATSQTTSVVITLHKTAYERCFDADGNMTAEAIEAGLNSAMEAHTNISIVKA